MKILVLTKRQYMAKDLIDDHFGRFWEVPFELAALGHGRNPMRTGVNTPSKNCG